MSGFAYAPTSPVNILSHWSGYQPLVRDYIAVDGEKLEAQIKSGDYFVTVATTLEVLAQRLSDRRVVSAENLERIADELLYLQNYYEITKKNETHEDR